MRTYVWLHSLVHFLDRPLPRRLRGIAAPRPSDQRGQASAEYALVLLGAAAIALLVTAWATRTNPVGRLLDAVLDRLLGQVR